MVVVEKTPDEILVQHAQERDAQGRSTRRGQVAFEELHERYKHQLFTYFRLHGIGQQTSEDLTQDTFMKAWRGLPKKSVDSPFRCWLLKIATNEFNSFFRTLKLKKNDALLVSLEGMIEYDPATLPASTEQGIEEQTIQRERISTILARLSLREQHCLLLFDRNGLSAKEVAEILKIRENSATSLLCRARQRFRELYEALDQQMF